MTDFRIKEEPAGFLDEFVATNVTVHFEAMDESQFWIGVWAADGRSWRIDCGAVNPRAKGYSRIEED